MDIKKTNFIIYFLCVLFLSSSISSMLTKSPTCDEAAHHVPAGYVLLKKADFKFSTETPPLSRYIMSAPMLFMDTKLPDEKGFWRRADRAEFSRNFLYGLNRGRVNYIFFFARIMMVLVAFFGGICFYLYVKKLYDIRVAVFAALFYFLSPNIIAHARLATTDITFTVMGMCSVFSFWQFLTEGSYKKAVYAALFTALALLTKYSACLLIFMYMMVFIVFLFYKKRVKRESVKNTVKTFFVFSFFVFLILWAGYLFEFTPLLADTMRMGEKENMFVNGFTAVFPHVTDALKSGFVSFLKNIPVPLGSYFLGLLGIIKHGTEGSRTYFIGAWSSIGNPFYYIVAFFIKTPIPVILSFLTGVVLGIKDRQKRALSLYLLFLIVGMFIFASRTNLQLGLRYVLVTYPLIFVFSGIGMVFYFTRGILYKIFGILLVVWFFISSFGIWPHYLSYFNEIIGGPDNGYKYLRDSNIDWGQDLPALKKFMTDNDIDTVRLDYFGEGDLSLYGIRTRRIQEQEFLTPENGVYAISVQHIDRYIWAKHRIPDYKAGYSMHIYDLREKNS